jgi:hypothetical protein
VQRPDHHADEINICNQVMMNLSHGNGVTLDGARPVRPGGSMHIIMVILAFDNAIASNAIAAIGDFEIGDTPATDPFYIERIALGSLRTTYDYGPMGPSGTHQGDILWGEVIAIISKSSISAFSHQDGITIGSNGSSGFHGGIVIRNVQNNW